MKRIIFIIVTTISILLVAEACKTSSEVHSSDASEKIDTKHYTFTADVAIPQNGRNVHLSPGYSLKIREDSIKAFLPYYGRAYLVSYPNGDGGINFTSTNFDYQVTPKNRGGWTAVITPKDIKGTYKMTMDIFENGEATLYVVDIHRRAISFRGKIE